MIKAILVTIQTGLLKLLPWDGWTVQDRVMITDMHRQIEHLKRRHEQRDMLLKKAGR